MSDDRTRSALRTFGAPRSGEVDRTAAYAVVLDSADRVAVVRGASGLLFLLGGGAHPGETPRETVAREVHEESGRPARALAELGEAVQYFDAAGGRYRMWASFFSAELGPVDAGVQPEHEVLWRPARSAGGFFHACHAWALGRALAKRGR